MRVHLFLGQVIISFYSQASILYPGRYVGLYWNVTSADVSSQSNEMTATIGGRVYVNADNANASDVIFSGLFVSRIKYILIFLKYSESIFNFLKID